MLRLKDICQLIDGEKRNGKDICLDAKYLRGKSSATIVEKGKFVYAGDNIILVDGENSGEVFTVAVASSFCFVLPSDLSSITDCTVLLVK